MKRKRVITILIALIIYLGVAAADFQTLPAQAQGENKNTNEAIQRFQEALNNPTLTEQLISSKRFPGVH